MRIVEAIQYCVELDIPLKEFSQFISEQDGQIDYASLIAYGNRITEQKMRSIQIRRDFLRNMQKEITHAENCYKDKIVTSVLPEKYCWVIPYDGVQTGNDFNNKIYQLVSDIEKHGLKAGYNNGQLMICRESKKETYIFIDLRGYNKTIKQFPQIVKIPGGEYKCVISKESHIHKAREIFPELFSQNYDKTVIEVELFTERFCYSNPIFELRCIMPPNWRN